MQTLSERTPSAPRASKSKGRKDRTAFLPPPTDWRTTDVTKSSNASFAVREERHHVANTDPRYQLARRHRGEFSGQTSPRIDVVPSADGLRVERGLDRLPSALRAPFSPSGLQRLISCRRRSLPS